MQPLKVVDLFSGIGGISLGLEATGGFSTAAFVEINPFCQKVLRHHWPQTPVFSDVRRVELSPGVCDAIVGGFPCQDVSAADRNSSRDSLLGDRSGLWWEYLRLIEGGKPTWVIIENVEFLRNRGLSVILWQLANLGYDAEWHIIPAYAVGLPHSRKRIWIVAHSHCNRVQGRSPFPLSGLRDFPWDSCGRGFEDFWRRSAEHKPWLLRSVAGFPSYVDRLTALGNSVVPQIPYAIGKAILTYYQETENVQS